jgi:DNA ligase-1
MEKHLNLLIQLEGITGNGSQKIKQDLIAANRSAEMDYIFQICYNPFITTKLNKVDYSPTTRAELSTTLFQDFQDLTEELRNAPSANNSHRDKACQLITHSGLNPEQQKMLGRILTKNMNISLGAKLINKAVGSEIIPDPSLMLAKDDIERIEKWKGIICELKYDGVRVIAKVPSTTSVEFFTRSFNQLPSRFLKKIEQEILRLAAGRTNIFFDGELTDFERTTVSGKVTSILAGTPPETIGDSFLFNLFDIEHSDVLNLGKGNTKYPVRRKNLEDSFAGKTFENLTLGTKWEVKNKEEIWAIYKHIVEVEKGEGVILKDPEHVYECKRSTSWIKMKEIKDCDLMIIGVNDPHSMSAREEKGWIGGFICQTSDKLLTVSVGSGFSEVFLEEIKAAGPSTFIGKIAKVKYNMLVKDKTGEWSLFLPTLLEVRPDKTEADSFSKLQASQGKA